MLDNARSPSGASGASIRASEQQESVLADRMGIGLACGRGLGQTGLLDPSAISAHTMPAGSPLGASPRLRPWPLR